MEKISAANFGLIQPNRTKLSSLVRWLIPNNHVETSVQNYELFGCLAILIRISAK